MNSDIRSVTENNCSWCVVEGDALDIARQLPSKSVDAIISDPPYASVESGSSALVKRKNGAGSISLKDTQFFQVWLDQHFIEWNRILKQSGSIWISCDMMGVACVERSALRVGMKHPTVGVWDRERMGMGWLLRKSFELFSVIPMANFDRTTASETDVWRHPYGPSDRKSGHPAEKPVALMRRAVKLLTKENDIVFDPFVGSGSTGVACVSMKRRFVGCDRDNHWATYARSRIQSTDNSAQPAQRSLLGEDTA